MEAKYILIIFSKEALEKEASERINWEHNNNIPRIGRVEIWDIDNYKGDDMETFRTYPHTIIPLDDKVLPVQHLEAIHWLLDTDDVYGELTLREALQNLIALALDNPLQPQVLS